MFAEELRSERISSILIMRANFSVYLFNWDIVNILGVGVLGILMVVCSFIVLKLNLRLTKKNILYSILRCVKLILY